MCGFARSSGFPIAYERIIVAVTGASGAVYARKVAERLLRSPQVAQVAVVCSANGRKVMEYERERLPEGEERMVWFDNDDLFAPPASGSAGYDGMVIVPCTMGSAGRIAAGISGDLIGRAADVMLKERRPLVLVVRETPLSTIHLRNLTLLSECGPSYCPLLPRSIPGLRTSRRCAIRWLSVPSGCWESLRRGTNGVPRRSNRRPVRSFRCGMGFGGEGSAFSEIGKNSNFAT